MTNSAAHTVLAAIAIVAIAAVACSGGGPPMTAAEYHEWCRDTLDAIDDADGGTVGDFIEALDAAKREYERVAGRAPEGARAGHNQVKEYLAALSDAYNDKYDRDVDLYDTDDTSPIPEPSGAEAYVDNWCR